MDIFTKWPSGTYVRLLHLVVPIFVTSCLSDPKSRKCTFQVCVCVRARKLSQNYFRLLHCSQTHNFTIRWISIETKECRKCIVPVLDEQHIALIYPHKHFLGITGQHCNKICRTGRTKHQCASKYVNSFCYQMSLWRWDQVYRPVLRHKSTYTK